VDNEEAIDMESDPDIMNDANDCRCSCPIYVLLINCLFVICISVSVTICLSIVMILKVMHSLFVNYYVHLN